MDKNEQQVIADMELLPMCYNAGRLKRSTVPAIHTPSLLLTWDFLEQRLGEVPQDPCGDHRDEEKCAPGDSSGLREDLSRHACTSLTREVPSHRGQTTAHITSDGNEHFLKL